MITRRMSMLTLAFAVVTLFVLLSGCEKMIEMMPEEQMPEPITIGIAVAQTGVNAEPYGLPMKRGLELAQEELNMVGANIMFAYEDPASTAEGATAAIQALVNAGVPAIIGIGISSHLKVAFPVAQEAGVVAFSPISSAAGLSKEVGDYVFRAGIATNILMPGGVDKTHSALNYSNVAVIFDEEDAYSTSLKDELKKTLDEKGINIVLEQPFTKAQADFAADIASISAKNVDALFVASLSTQMIEIIKAAGGENGLGADVALIVPDLTNAEVEAADGAADGAYAFAGWSSKSNTPGNQEFVQAYMAKFDGRAPEPWAAQAYASLYILANAINNAESTDAAAIRDALAATSSLPTILGPFSFDPMEKPSTKELM